MKTLISAVISAIMLFVSLGAQADIQLISEGFDATAGSDISSLGWVKTGTGPIIVGDVVIDKGNSAYISANSTASYEKDLSTAQSIGSEEVVALSAVLEAKSDTASANRAGLGVKTNAGNYVICVYRANNNTNVWSIELPGKETPVLLPLPDSNIFDARIVLGNDHILFYGRCHGSNYWQPLYEASGGVSSVTGALIKLETTNSSESPRIDSIYLGYSDEFGKRWIRSHPFLLSSQSIAVNPILSDFTQYTNTCGLNSLQVELRVNTSVSADSLSSINIMKQHSMPWQGILGASAVNLALIQHVQAASSSNDDNGWCIIDEPGGDTFVGVGKVRDWLKKNRPNSLVYANCYPNYEDSFVDGFITNIRPDVFMYDEYPSFDPVNDDYPYNGEDLYAFINAMRAKAQLHRLPVWTWLQSWYSPTMLSRTRMPSESELRRQAFTHLASGTKGFSYFTYDSNDAYSLYGLLKVDGTQTTLFPAAANANKEIAVLGEYLKYLESTDIRFVPGSSTSSTQWLTNWSPGAGGESRISGFSVNSYTRGKNGFIGFLTDDAGQSYFMLTNQYTGPTSSAADTTATFNIALNSGVQGVYRLNRSTGTQEWLSAVNGSVSVTLPGGTGDLFTFSSSGFDLAPPVGTVSIESGSSQTVSTAVTLAVSTSDDHGMGQMRFSNDGSTWNAWEDYTTSKQWTLTSGDGLKVVYAQFKDAFGRVSPVVNDSITLGSKVLNPVISPSSGMFGIGSTKYVTITCDTAGATIYYSTNGGTPSTLYTSPIPISSNTTISAVATKSGAASSDIVSATYTFVAPSSTGSSGIDTNGLLVTIWGRVTGTGGTGSGRYFYIDDGSHLYDGNDAGCLGVRILAETITRSIMNDEFLSVTGIIRPVTIGGKSVHAIQLENDAKILAHE